MKKHRALKSTAAALAAAAALVATSTAAVAADGQQGADLAAHGAAQRIAGVYSNVDAKNVILFIGDGMGDSEITVARNYLHGASGSFDGLDQIGQPDGYGDPSAGTGQYTTYSLGTGIENKNSPQVTQVTDSAASASAWSTGTKTYNNALDVDVYGNPQLNLTEIAKAANKATGNVTTSEIQDATPAAQMSHSTLRSCYGPQGKATNGTDNNATNQCEASQLKENGGIGSISEQLLDTRADVTLGGGNSYFNQVVQAGEYKGMTLAEQAEAMGYQYVTDPADLAGIAEANQDSPLLGLFSSGNMPTQYLPSVATLQDPIKDENPITCETNPDWLGNQEVSLADMTSKAIELLSASENGQQNGFFLQVEGASIDKQDHNSNTCGQIGETDDLDKAISAALSMVDLSETLIIVTADHAHTSQIVEEQPYYSLSTVLQSPVDGSTITVAYGNSSAQMYQDDKNASFDEITSSMSHTGSQLRVAASGPGAQRVNGLTDQTDLFYTLASALGLAATSEELAALSDSASVQLVQDVESGEVSVQNSGFNGDVVLAYSVVNAATGKEVAASTTADGVSGVRVKTAQTTEFSLGSALQAGTTYKVKVTGRQSGQEVTVQAVLDANSSLVAGSDNGEDEAGSGGAAGGTAGSSGSLAMTGATVAVLLVAAIVLTLAGVVVKRRRTMGLAVADSGSVDSVSAGS